MYAELIDNCLEIEADNPELCPNSDEARRHLRDAQRRRDEYYRATYVGESVIKPGESVIKPKPPAKKEVVMSLINSISQKTTSIIE